MNSVTAQHPLQNTLGACSSASAVPFRPRLATTHSILILRGVSLFFFFFVVGGGGGGTKRENRGDFCGQVGWPGFCKFFLGGWGLEKTETAFPARRKGSGE